MVAGKHIIDPDKLSQTFQIKWQHPCVDGIDEKIIIDDSYIFDLNNGSELTFSENAPNTISLILISNNKKHRPTIVFGNITDIAFLKKAKMLILESKTKEYFSQMWINCQGDFNIQHGMPTKNYKYRWIFEMPKG